MTITIAGGLIAGLVAILAAPGAFAQTGETDADFSKYCREAFVGSAYQMRAQSWGPEHYCNQGGTLQGIDFAKACEATTGSGRYRVMGARVLCREVDGPSDEGTTLTTQDFVDYCREKFSNSAYQQSPEPTGAAHYCRRPGASGGFSLQNIDLADLCRTKGGSGEYDRKGGEVTCMGAAAERRAAASGGAGSADRQADGSDAGPETAPRTGDEDDRGSGKAVGGTGGLAGLWRLTDNSIRRFMTVRLELDGDRVTGTIVEIPDELAQAVRMMDGIGPGDAFLHGRIDGDRITGTTRFGLAAASQVMNQPGNVKCRGFIAAIEADPSRWMKFSLSRKGGLLTGRHDFRGLTVDAASLRCMLVKVPDTPPRLLGGQALFEMEKVAGKANESALKQGDCKEPGPEDAPEWPASWVENTREYNRAHDTSYDLVVPADDVGSLSLDQIGAIGDAYPCPDLGTRSRVLFQVDRDLGPLAPQYVLILARANPHLARRLLQDESAISERWLRERPDTSGEPEEVRRLEETRWKLSVARDRAGRLDAVQAGANRLLNDARQLQEQGLAREDQVDVAEAAQGLLEYAYWQQVEYVNNLQERELRQEEDLRTVRQRESPGGN